ncbi:MAG: Crp/Fnr family transcriptional regulator [Hyphomicrobiales bacterium]|nr:hypothetical protein [Rhodobiaceae bacterium]OUT82233.1 MAG: hypothetical protein CBB88_05655 [Rhizobiales bacterium TMED28]RZO34150.1 MAG: Crp/Fnr family transcriptional regulator [Hyphomicrobiales bacterium]|tara:strand:- start:1334 stop:1765 length:432 start_codon:yes stop_codon:yes gene_type:complete
MNINQTIKILKKTESFGMQTDSFLNTLAFTSEKIEYSTGDLIIKSGEKSIKCVVILEGKAFIQKKTSPIELKAGSVVGLLSLINNTYPKDALIAGTKGLAMVINRELFDKLLQEFPDFNRNLKTKIISDLNKKVTSLNAVIGQ